MGGARRAGLLVGMIVVRFLGMAAGNEPANTGGVVAGNEPMTTAWNQRAPCSAGNRGWMYIFDPPADFLSLTHLQRHLVMVGHLVKHLEHQLHSGGRLLEHLRRSIEHLRSKDCSGILRLSNGTAQSGIYTIHPDPADLPDPSMHPDPSMTSDPNMHSDPTMPPDPSTHPSIRVFCRMEAGQGWTVLQRRQDGSEDFYRSWADYRRGFGNLSAEFWLGNDYIHRLTNQGRSKLRIDLAMFDGEASFAEYGNFSVVDESSGYRLTAGGYSGTAGDALRYSRDQAFHTRDRDSVMGAVQKYRGAGWFYTTHFPSLNGVYYTPQTLKGELAWMCKIKWCNLRKGDGPIKFVEMKITKAP